MSPQRQAEGGRRTDLKPKPLETCQEAGLSLCDPLEGRQSWSTGKAPKSLFGVLLCDMLHIIT